MRTNCNVAYYMQGLNHGDNSGGDQICHISQGNSSNTRTGSNDGRNIFTCNYDNMSALLWKCVVSATVAHDMTSKNMSVSTLKCKIDNENRRFNPAWTDK